MSQKINKDIIPIKSDGSKYNVRVIDGGNSVENLLKTVKKDFRFLVDYEAKDDKNLVKERINKSIDGDAKKLEKEDFNTSSIALNFIEPPLDMYALSELIEYNSELEECITAMEINIAGLGYRIVPRNKKNKEKDSIIKENIANAKTFLENNCNELSFDTFRRKLRREKELTGNVFIEVVLDSTNKEVMGFSLIPSWQMRLTKYSDPILSEKNVIYDFEDKYEVKKEKKLIKFRRFCQVDSSGQIQVWFKEFGDPRKLDCKTGKFQDEQTEIIDPKNYANAIIHDCFYNSLSPYGLPRFKGTIINIHGSRLREEVCFTTLGNNNVPSIFISVADGQLTEASIKRLTEFWKNRVGGLNYSKVVIVEAMSITGDANTKLQIQPMSQDQVKDAMWSEYDKNNCEKIRRNFRLPPIYVGRAEDYNRSTSEISRRLAEEQIFQPERVNDNILFNKILSSKKFYDVVLESNTPTPTDSSILSALIVAAEKAGGMTPRIAHMMLEEILGRDLPDPSSELDIDKPFSLQYAEAMKKESYDSSQQQNNNDNILDTKDLDDEKDKI